MHRVFVTGGTGFVGRALVQALRAEGHVVRCLTRRGSEADLKGLEAIERVEGDVLESADGLAYAMSGCDAVVHLVGIIREIPARAIMLEQVHIDGTANVVTATETAGVRRYLHMSALGTRPNARARYHQTKWRAEDVVRASALDWTIFRPSIIYGPGDAFITMLARMIRALPAVPVIGTGRSRLQPVQVGLVAEGIARALDHTASIGRTWEVGGPDVLMFDELLDLIATVIKGRPVPKVHIPVAVVRALARFFENFAFFPVTRDQLLMLEEDNVCDAEPFLRAFGLAPVPLKEGLERMLTP
jgi:NADH dehydrogenase